MLLTYVNAIIILEKWKGQYPFEYCVAYHTVLILILQGLDLQGHFPARLLLQPCRSAWHVAGQRLACQAPLNARHARLMPPHPTTAFALRQLAATLQAPALTFSCYGGKPWPT